MSSCNCRYGCNECLTEKEQRERERGNQLARERYKREQSQKKK